MHKKFSGKLMKKASIIITLFFIFSIFSGFISNNVKEDKPISMDELSEGLRYDPHDPEITGYTSFKIDPPNSGTYTKGSLQITISVSKDNTLNWQSNIPIYCVYVKGGNETGDEGKAFGYVYKYSGVLADDGLHAIMKNDKYQGISHVTFYYKEQQPPQVTGTINVEKKLVDENGNDIKDTENKFSIKLAWQNGREKVEVEEIKAGEIKSFSGLPLGSYTISEESIPEIYELVGIDKPSVTLTDENKEVKVVITNRIKPIIPPPVIKGTINVEKKLVDEKGNIINGDITEFSIKVAGNDKVYEDKIKAGETKGSKDLPLGLYTISEESIPEGYELVSIDKSEVNLTNENKEAKVVITNKKKSSDPPPVVTGTINVEKKLVDGNDQIIQDNENRFSIKLSGPDGREKVEEIIAGETKSFTGLPLGAYIISEESIPPIYELVGIDKSSVTLTNENKEAKVVITNRIKPIIPPPVIKGIINVEKKLVDSNGNIINGDVTEFNIKVAGNDKLYEDKIKAGEIKGFKELFLGAYTISEENMPQGYELISIDKSEVNLTNENKEAKVVITNKKKSSNPPPVVTGTINVEKKLVDGNDQIIQDNENRFSIKLSGPDGREKVEEIIAGETKSFTGLPLGAYIISEESIPPIYELVSIDKSSVTLTNENKEAKVVITNRIKPIIPPPVIKGTINVEKKLVDANGNIINGDVTEFSIKVAGNDKVYEDKIKAGEIKGFKELFLGAYTISEENMPQGYELISIDKSEVNLTNENKEAKVIITNKKKPSNPPPDGGDDSDDDDNDNDDEPSISYGAIGDYIWLDENEDGKQDANEKAIPNVKVILTKTDGTKVMTSTDSSGKYKFNNLLSGKYTVTVDDTTLSKELKATYELDGILDYAVVVELKSGEVREDIDFGYAKIKTDTIEDKVPEENKDKPEDKGKVEEDKKPVEKPVDEKPIDKKPVDNKPNNNKIPQTGTENFNILLLGALTSIVSGIYIILSKKKDHMV